MTQAKSGDTVRLHYTGKLDDGTVVESSRERAPLEITLGRGDVITGFECAVEGMEPGESKSVHVPVGDAFGPRQDAMIVEIERGKLPGDLQPQIGQEVQLHGKDEKAIPAVVTAVSDATVTVDANHPLAGKELIFEIELMEIV